MRIRAFQGLRPKPELVEQVVSVPYDVVDTEEARALAEGLPLSLLHVVRAEIDFPAGQDPYADEVYAKAAENFRRLQEEGALLREDGPALYVYQQRMGEHVQKGVMAVTHVDDYENDLIKKHEKTRQAKEDDRTRLTSDLSANPGPVFLTYKARGEIDALIEQTCAQPPLYDFTAVDGVQHTLWKIDEPEAVVKAFGPVDCFYVADGHHRSASAARVGKERKAANPGHTGEEDYNWFLSVLFPENQLQILPYNRLVDDLHGLSPEEFVERVQTVCAVSPDEGGSAEDLQTAQARMYLGGKWYRLQFSVPEDADPVSRLDVSLLQEGILDPLLGVGDPRTSERIRFVGGIRGEQFLVQEVDAGRAAVAFSLHPVTVQQLMDIADAGQIMPPKSTWFEPKLRSGLAIHTF